MIYPSLVNAQTPATPSSTSKESKPTFEVSQLPSSISPTSPIYTDVLIHNMFHTFSCLAVGQSVIGQPCLTYQITKNAQGAIQSVPMLSSVNLSGGTLGALTGVIGSLYQNPPVRTYDALASLGQSLGMVKSAQAQGVIGSGANVLSPIITLWQVSRNVAYIIMILIFVVIGLMVMFRQRINPQTVITAQAAIPGLVIGLILITFSYFMAGLISDTAFLGTNLVGAYFSAVRGQADNPQNLVLDISGQNILNIISPLTKIMNADSLSSAIGSIWGSLAAPNSNILPWNFGPQQLLTSLAAIIITQFVLPFGSLFGGIVQLISGGLAVGITVLNPVGTIGFALSFVAIAILIYQMFRLLLRLINTYINIIFLTVTAPFQFLFSSLPGRQGLATEWILNFLGHALAFPAVLAVLYFVAFILGPQQLPNYCATPCPFRVSQLAPKSNDLITTAHAQGESVKVTGNAAFPLLGGFDLSFINLLLAFGALIALPAIPDIVQRTIGKVSQAGQLIGQEIGAGTGAGQRYAGQVQQGVTGFAGQVGQLTDTPGYRPVTGRPGQFERVTASTIGLSEPERAATGYRPGLGRRIRAWFR